MNELLVNENELLDSKELRNKLASRIEVFDRVKNLLLIPENEFASMEQIASYYSTIYTEEEKKLDSDLSDVIITVDAIKKIYQRNQEEFNNDGVSLKSYKDFLSGQNVSLENFKGKSILTFNNGDNIEVPNRGLRVFPRRAILRIGMLLRDSKVAIEIRNQLLNIEEKTSTEIKTQDINEEQKLMLEIGMAVASGNATAVAIASSNLIAFKNRHINKLEQSNNALANGILEWEDRSRINFAVRKLAQTAHLQYGNLWNELYKQLKNKYHIDLKARGKQPWIQYVEEAEWNCVIKSFSALCKYYGQEPSDMFCDLVLQEVK